MDKLFFCRYLATMEGGNIHERELYYLHGLRDNNLEILDKIYKEYLPRIVYMVTQNQGTVEDAHDIFQEALVITYHKSNRENFQLRTSFFGYLRAVCQKLWWRQLKKKHRSDITFEGKEGFLFSEDIEPLAEEAEKWILFQQKMAMLGKDCRQVLEGFFRGVKLKTIAAKMGYTDKYIKWKKYKCKEKLIELIKADRRYRELKD